MIISSKKGITLIETVIAIFFISLISLVLFHVVYSGIESREVSRQKLESLALATSYMEDIKTRTRSGLTSFTAESVDNYGYHYNINVNIVNDEPATGLLNVEVSVGSVKSSPVTLKTVLRK